MKDNSKTLISQKEAIILLKSKAIDNFPNLKCLLENHPKITESIINSEEVDIETKRLISTKAHIEIYLEARKEWIAMSDYDIGVTHCSLCHRKNHQIYYIKNTLNGNILNVGSDCIRHFPNLKNEENIDIKDIINRDKKIRIRVTRREKLKEKFSDLNSRLAHYKSIVNNSPYLVNYDIFSKLELYLSKIRDLQSKYLDGKGTDEYLELISDYLKKLEYLLNEKLATYNKTLAGNRFACTKGIYNWLKNNGRNNIINKIREQNSIITKDTISYIASIPFIDGLINDYKEILSDNLKSISIDKKGNDLHQKIYVKFNNKFFNDFYFCCTPEEFMKNIGDLIFCESLPTNKTQPGFLLNIFSIEENEMSVLLLFSKLNRLLSGYQFLCNYEKNYFNLGKIYIVNRTINKIVEIRSIDSITKHLLKYFHTDNYTFLCENNYLKRLKWKVIDDIQKEEINKCIDWMKRASAINNEYY